jgi:Leucine-rich repeat (LRR) protein
MSLLLVLSAFYLLPRKLHHNRICVLPDTFADLTALTSLDLSHNSLTSVPINIFALPTLSILNLSHNALVALPFGEPFSGSSRRSRTDTYSSGGFFGPVITRANVPVPRLLSLDVSFNKLTASAIDHENLPSGLSKVDLSSNPIASGNSDSSALIRAFGSLSQLKELRLANADIGDDAFPSTLFTGNFSRSFSSLRILDLGETRANAEAMALAFSGLKQSIVFDMTADELSEGTLRITVGKKVLKEAWEIEAERRVRHRSGKSLADERPTLGTTNCLSHEGSSKEAWEIEAEQGLLTEGGRRRARAAAAATTESSVAAASAPSSQGKRRSVTGIGHPSSPPPQGVSSSSFNLNNPQYYDAATQTLALPASAPPARSHARSFSLAASALNAHATSGKNDIALPTPSLPIAAIFPLSFAQTLKILVLSNRKLDLSVSLPHCRPDMDAGLIPNLEELVLDGCGLGDNVAVTRQVEGGATPIKSSEPLFPLLTRLFPNLRTLDVSYNALTSAALGKDGLIGLIMASEQDTASRTGLRHLRLRGNRITTLDGFQEVAEIFKGHRSVPDWKLEELDLRDNEISKLPPELGLLPLDVFLVDGNM